MKKKSYILFLFLLALPLWACNDSDESEQLNGDPIVKTETLNVDKTSPLSDQNSVIYELNVGSFTTEGTFTAATTKLNDLRTLGIDIVWLMPIYPRGGGINSPYAATDYQAVNPSYGTISDLKTFVSKAHSLGMKVWLDWVPNHTATNHRWVTEHPEYYVKDANGNIIHPNNYGDVYQLDYTNNSLCDAMNNCLKYWIDQADIDGYRCDYISSPAIPASYWQLAIPMLKAHKSSLIVMAEGDLTDTNNKRLQNVGFDFDYAWQFQEGLLFNQFGSSGTNASALQGNLESFLSASQALSNDRMVYLTNHDQNYNDGGRSLKEMYGDNTCALTTLVFTLYGMPLLYNGQETGNDQILDYFNDTKIKWTVGDRKVNNTIRTLIALKHSQKALAHGNSNQRGNIRFLNTGNNSVIAYERTKDDNTVVVLLNFGTNQQNIRISDITSGEYVQWLDSKTIAAGPVTKQVKLNSSDPIVIGTKGYAVYVKN